MGLDAGASKGEVGSAFVCKMIDQQWSCHMSSTCTLAAHLLWHVLEVFILKVSLHAPNQALREELVPAAKAFAAQPRISKWLVDLMMIWWHWCWCSHFHVHSLDGGTGYSQVIHRLMQAEHMCFGCGGVTPRSLWRQSQLTNFWPLSTTMQSRGYLAWCEYINEKR